MPNGRITASRNWTWWLPPAPGSYPAYTTVGNYLPEVGAAGTGGIEIAHPINGYILRSHLFVPAAAVNTVPLPLIIFMGGAGDRGDANWIVNGTMKSAAALKSTQFGAVITANLSTYPYFALIPQLAGGNDVLGGPRYGRTGVLQALQYVLNNYNIDRTRMHLVGYSYGSVQAFSLAYRFPRGFASLTLFDGIPVQLNLSDSNNAASDLMDGSVFTTNAQCRAEWHRVVGDIPLNYQHGAKDDHVDDTDDFTVRINDPIATPNLYNGYDGWFTSFAAGGKTYPTTYAATTHPSPPTPSTHVYVPYAAYDHGTLNGAKPYDLNSPWWNWLTARVRTDYAAGT